MCKLSRSHVAGASVLLLPSFSCGSYGEEISRSYSSLLMGIALNLFLCCLMELAKREVPDVSPSWCKPIRLSRSKMDGSFDCDCGELEPPDH
ncbi:unnamed protein product [Bubo scandiacus]